MAFVAIDYLSLNGPNGSKITIGPGEVVPGFADWNIHQRRGHLNLHKVREVPDDEVIAVEPEEEVAVPERDTDLVLCPHCPNKSFASKRGLAIHIGQQHR